MWQFTLECAEGETRVIDWWGGLISKKWLLNMFVEIKDSPAGPCCRASIWSTTTYIQRGLFFALKPLKQSGNSMRRFAVRRLSWHPGAHASAVAPGSSFFQRKSSLYHQLGLDRLGEQDYLSMLIRSIVYDRRRLFLR